MEKSKRFLVFLTAALPLLVLAAPAFAGGRSQAGGELKDIDFSRPVEVVMFHTQDEPPRQQELHDNFNALLKTKMPNTTLKINYLGTVQWETRYPLAFASGEAMDLAYAATWLNFSQLAKRGSFKILDDLAPKYAPKLFTRQTRTAIQQSTVDGHLYGLPSLVATYSAYGPVYRTDLVKDKGWNGRMESFADLEQYLAIIKANYPQLEPFQIYAGGSNIHDVYLYNNGMHPIKGSTGDFLFIDPAQPNPKLFTYYEWNKTPELLQMTKRWNEAGYFPKSALADQYATKFRDGVAAAYFHNIDNYDGEYQRKPEWEIRYSNFVSDLSNMSFTQDTCVVPSTSRNSDRGLALYDLIMSDEALYRAFYYGIEGKTYRIHNQNGQNYVEAVREVVPSVYNFSTMWAARTREFYLPTWGAPPDLMEMKRGYDAGIKDGAGAQKYRSFVIDISSIENEYAACINAHQQYWGPLALAYVDISTGLTDYEAAMKSAGIDRVRQVLQQQLDAYIAALK